MNADLGKLILRVGVSALMIPHGYGKLVRAIESDGPLTFADPLGVGQVPTLIIAIAAEFLCPILIIIGWKTRLNTILPIITMAVAAFVIHIDDPWSKMEFPLLYMFSFMAIGLLGAGKWSVDRR